MQFTAINMSMIYPIFALLLLNKESFISAVIDTDDAKCFTKPVVVKEYTADCPCGTPCTQVLR